MPFSPELEEVRRYVQLREETDYIMPLWLPCLPYILILAGMVGMVTGIILTPKATPILVFGAVGVFVALAIVGEVIDIYVVYKWVKRRNEHFKRRMLLTEALLTFARSLSSRMGKDVNSILNEIEREIREARYEESEKNPVLWALLQIVPYVGAILLLYVYHFLNKDFVKHFRREVRILDQFKRVFTELGAAYFPMFSRDYEFPDRSTVLYIVLTIITLGFFGVYWVYTLTKDPNEHFKEHSRVESTMLEVLEKIA